MAMRVIVSTQGTFLTSQHLILTEVMTVIHRAYCHPLRVHRLMQRCHSSPFLILNLVGPSHQTCLG